MKMGPLWPFVFATLISTTIVEAEHEQSRVLKKAQDISKPLLEQVTAPDRKPHHATSGAALGQAALPDGAPAPNGKSEKGTTPASKQAVTKEVAAASAGSASPTDMAMSAEKGTLTNPYSDYESVAPEGRKIWLSAGCNGCHGWVAVVWGRR